MNADGLLTVPCPLPSCGAKAGDPCGTEYGQRPARPVTPPFFHLARVRALPETGRAERPAREVAHDPDICNVAAWQCSGCKGVFFGGYRYMCQCSTEGGWSGSIVPAALAAAEPRRPHTKACDRVTEAIEADRRASRSVHPGDTGTPAEGTEPKETR